MPPPPPPPPAAPTNSRKVGNWREQLLKREQLENEVKY
jgi:hypothetical protein